MDVPGARFSKTDLNTTWPLRESQSQGPMQERIGKDGPLVRFLVFSSLAVLLATWKQNFRSCCERKERTRHGAPSRKGVLGRRSNAQEEND